MRHLHRRLGPLALLLLGATLAVQPAGAQGAHYPDIEDAWDGTSYRALVERVETQGLALPTLADKATRPVFERMVNVNNIPLHMGLNQKLAVGIRFQRLNSALPPIHKLVALYATAAQGGKPYRRELARMMAYGCRVSAALLDLGEPYLATLEKNKRYQIHVDHLDQVRTGARRLYVSLVQGITETSQYDKADILIMVDVAIDGLPSYQPIFTSEERRDLVARLTQQISRTDDPELKTAFTQLRDAIQHRQIRT